jgi:hypothetical protein
MTLISGRLTIDKNGERFFLMTREDTRAAFGSRVLIGRQQLRLLTETGDPLDMSVAERQDVTVAGRIATAAEMAVHDQLTDPTLVVKRLAEAQTIRQRAFEIFETGRGGTALDNWVHAECQLLELVPTATV